MYTSPLNHPERRASERFDFPSTIEFKMDSLTDSETHRAVIVNISTVGIGAYVFAPHAVGQKITIKTPLPVGSRSAVVRWTRKEDESFYLAGLSFDDPSTLN